MTNNDMTFSLDDALAAIDAYANAIHNDNASDSTLDDLQYTLDCMLAHDDLLNPALDDNDRLDIIRDLRFPDSTINARQLHALRTIAIHLFELRD